MIIQQDILTFLCNMGEVQIDEFENLCVAFSLLQ